MDEYISWGLILAVAGIGGYLWWMRSTQSAPISQEQYGQGTVQSYQAGYAAGMAARG